MIDENSNETILHDYGRLIQHSLFTFYDDDEALVLWKGSEYILDKNLGRFRIIDLSSNKIEGEIPREIAILSSLRQLNLSNNKLSGAIPEEIDGLKQLESLDLSQNQLSGRLPASMSNLNFLNTLNLSHNNFLGKIPSGTQLQTFNASTYSNNPALCGSPLPLKCPEDDIQDSPSNRDDQDNQENEFNKSLYLGMGVGFASLTTKFGMDWCGSSTPRTPEYRTMNEERHERKAYWLVIVRPQFLTGGGTNGLRPSIPF
ncbi:hypothetical protein JCGZ_08371 [Jatropha curcas]|uniref:Leucine-rich repeat-containing N-terminal plant-type domain-containing protein n=1 Tax=Jatropha curcas TaxID=180498 RepID=A0A067KXN0_JATCU|nr:hypothetical protein JCGZ_08371 [Jatropha curcas]